MRNSKIVSKYGTAKIQQPNLSSNSSKNQLKIAKIHDISMDKRR